MTPTTQNPLLSERFEEALGFAAKLHVRQIRKGSGIPYISHLLSVAALVMEDHGSEDEVIAALLHDAVEDQGGFETREKILQKFGPEVCALVDAVTDSEGSPKPPWQERKERLLRQMENASEGAMRICTADKLHNVRTLVADVKRRGDEAWEPFQKDRDENVWFFTAFVETIKKRFSSPMLDELQSLIEQL